MELTKREEYLNIQKNSLGDKYEFILDNEGLIAPIGQGGSGIVYLANQIFSDNKSVFTKRAVKFFIFRDNLMDDWGYVSTANFDTEIKNISIFSHQNVLKVIDGNYYNILIENEPIKIPYTVTEFIDGPNLEELYTDANIDKCKQLFNNEEAVFDLLKQIIDGLIYLHKNCFYHCDIAPKNIFLKTDGKEGFLAVIGDLGAGRTIVPDAFNSVKLVGTKNYMPPDIIHLKNKDVSYENFCDMQPRWDIYSTILSMKEIIENVRKCCQTSFDFWNLERLYEKLNEHDYDSILDLSNDIEHLRPSSNQIFKLDELSEASKNIGQVLLPINSAYLSRRMRKISKHDMLLRLMDVPQLLEGATTFPGANHTRYEHSLGTYEHMRKAMLALLRNKVYAKFLSEKNVVIGLLSALLSSLINFPYSYAVSELLIQDDALFKELSPIAVFQKLMNMKSEVTNKSLLECIDELFGVYQIEMSDLTYVIYGKHGSRKSDLDILNSILNSSVGVKVIDYTMRDSHHIGLTYEVNTTDLFKSMSISKSEFCLKQSGISSAEQIITNRYWLFKRIYWSDPNRANAALLKHLFYSVYCEEFANDLLDGIHCFSKIDIQNLILKYAGDMKSSLSCSIKLINQKGQDRYKSILVLDKNSPYAHSNETCDTFIRMSYSQQYEIRNQVEATFIKEYKIPEGIINSGVILLIDIPYEKSGNKLGDDIRIQRYDNSYLSLNKASGIVSGLKTSFEDQLMLLRVFLRPDIFFKVIDTDKRKREDIEQFLSTTLHDLL